MTFYSGSSSITLRRPGGSDIIAESGLVAGSSGGDTPEIGGSTSSVIAGTNSRAKGHLDPVAAEMGLTRKQVQSKGDNTSANCRVCFITHPEAGRREKEGRGGR